MSTAKRVRGSSPEPSPRRADLPALALIAALGGVAGPLLLLFGLRHTTGVAGSLLLNLEAPWTLLLAVAVFGEHLSTRMVIASTAILAAGALLTIEPRTSTVSITGSLAIAAACLAWAIDNNVTQRLSSRDPLAIVQVKAGMAAVGLALIAVMTRSRWPGLGVAAVATGVGALGYGCSIVLDVRALRSIGAAREAALFATAPFVGAVLAVPMFSAHLTPSVAIAGTLMGVGVVAFTREAHGHVHVHDPIEHDHVHGHDTHHRHDHTEADEPDGVRVHNHRHTHQPSRHAHAHVSDEHHRHPH